MQGGGRSDSWHCRYLRDDAGIGSDVHEYMVRAAYFIILHYRKYRNY